MKQTVKKRKETNEWLDRLLALWLIAFASLLVFLYFFFIGFSIDGLSMYEILFS